MIVGVTPLGGNSYDQLGTLADPLHANQCDMLTIVT